MRPNLDKNIASIVWIYCILFIAGCGGCGQDKPLQHIDLKPEAKELTVRFERFDNDLFNADFSNPTSACQQLYQKYGSFFCNFVENDLLLAECQSDSVGRLLIPMMQNADIRQTRNEIQTIFTAEKMESLESDLTGLVRRWHHYFPDSIAPRIVFYQSAWNNNIAPTDSALGIALDCYLGGQHPITQKLPKEIFPNYKKANMDERYIVPDAAKGWVAMQARTYYRPGDFLNELIFYGKLMYLAEALVPDVDDARMMSWTDEELLWSEKNEYRIWKEMANEKVMFQTRKFEIAKWFDDAPFTNAQALPQNSPPQLGVWMGWKMVRQYMEANPTITLQDLLEEKDNQKILSTFKPAKPA